MPPTTPRQQQDQQRRNQERRRIEVNLPSLGEIGDTISAAIHNIPQNLQLMDNTLLHNLPPRLLRQIYGRQAEQFELVRRARESGVELTDPTRYFTYEELLDDSAPVDPVTDSNSNVLPTPQMGEDIYVPGRGVFNPWLNVSADPEMNLRGFALGEPREPSQENLDADIPRIVAEEVNTLRPIEGGFPVPDLLPKPPLPAGSTVQAEVKPPPNDHFGQALEQFGLLPGSASAATPPRQENRPVPTLPPTPREETIMDIILRRRGKKPLHVSLPDGINKLIYNPYSEWTRR